MIRRLLVLNGLASTAVAFHHAAAYGFLALFNWTNAYRDVVVPNYDMLGTPAYYYLLAVRLLIGSYAIPAFLIVSGFYAAFAADSTGRMTWVIIWTRVKKFVGPFIVWTLVFFGMQRAVPRSLNDILQTYYYIPLIIQLYLLSPWLGPLAFDKGKLPLEKELGKLGVMSLGIYLVNTPAIYITSSLLYKFTPWVLGWQILYQPILTAAGLFIPLLLMKLFKWPPLKQYSPVIFG